MENKIEVFVQGKKVLCKSFYLLVHLKSNKGLVEYFTQFMFNVGRDAFIII